MSGYVAIEHILIESTLYSQFVPEILQLEAACNRLLSCLEMGVPRWWWWWWISGGGDDGDGGWVVLRKVDIRLPGKGDSNSRGARPVYSFR